MHCSVLFLYCGFHLMQFWQQFLIQKGFERSAFSLQKQRKIKSLNMSRATWATKALLSYKLAIHNTQKLFQGLFYSARFLKCLGLFYGIVK